MRVGVIGIGRWGKNLLSEFHMASALVACANRSGSVDHAWVRRSFPRVEVREGADSIILDKSLDAVAIATPISTHAPLVRKALEAGKHVFVEKPLSTHAAEAAELASLAEKKGLVLLVGHVFLYHPCFRKIAALVHGERITGMRFSWKKLGTFDEDIVWNLATHELALAIALMGQPSGFVVHGREGVVSGCDFLSFSAEFPGGRRCAFELDRFSPEKRKTVLVRTARRELLWDGDAILSFERGRAAFRTIFRAGRPALRSEVREFLRCIRSGARPVSDGQFGAGVVGAARMLAEAAGGRGR
ncbi:MAG: Gfo/Idh/MocA family oxidoreductase [Candidatus Micrarchaeota archaeon]